MACRRKRASRTSGTISELAPNRRRSLSCRPAHAGRGGMAQVDLVQRYRHLRVVSSEVQTAALGQVPWTAVIEFGRRVGAVRKGELALEWEDELKLVRDLAMHTAKNQRSRAIDRYARVAPYPADSDQAHMLKALQDARFTIFQIKERHPVAGVMISDLFREQRFHLMDMGIAMSAGIGD